MAGGVGLWAVWLLGYGDKNGCCENDGCRDSRAVVCKEGPRGGPCKAIPSGVELGSSGSGLGLVGPGSPGDQ